MRVLPTCTTKNTILDADLLERAKNGELMKLVVVPIPGEQLCYVVAFFNDEKRRPIYLATRRNRKEPKTFVDQKRLMANLQQNFAAIPIEFQLQALDADGVPVL